ncbi:MAG: ABC transporter substrate binding protein [Phycisphaerae bacterium]
MELAKLGHTTETVQLKKLPKDLAALAGKTDAFVAVGTDAALYLHGNPKATTKMAYCMVADPVGMGLGGDQPPPGVSTDIPITPQFALIAEALPGARTVGMLYSSSSPRSKRMLEAARTSLPKAWSLKPVDMAKHSSASAAIEALLDCDMDIVWTAPDRSVLNVATIRSLLRGAMRKRMPIFGFSTGFVRAGALLGVGIDPAAQGHQAAGIADRLVRGRAHQDGKAPAKRGDVPPEFQVAVNLIVAERLGVVLPEGLVRRADLVFREKTDKPQ